MHEKIEDVFRRLNELITLGQLTRADVEFMETYLEAVLATTKKMKERIRKAEPVEEGEQG